MQEPLSMLEYVVNHVFLPPKLPQKDDTDETKELALAQHVYRAARDYSQSLPQQSIVQWSYIVKALKNLCLFHERFILSEDVIQKSLFDMNPGDILGILIRAQNAAVIVRNLGNSTIFESFEVSPTAGAVMGCSGRLICSYPGPAIAISSDTVKDPGFRKELASFLSHMNVNRLDSAPVTRKAGSKSVEERDTVHPRYITQLLTEILRGMGEPAQVTRISKRIRDDVLWDSAFKPWRRSSLWLLIRVLLQTSLCGENGSHIDYKGFMAFLMARLLQFALDENLSSDLLFCMRAKVSRRVIKMGSSTPKFVQHYVRKVAEQTGVLLQARWSLIQQQPTASPLWTPKTLDIEMDTRLSLINSRSYISEVMQGSRLPNNRTNIFNPNHVTRFRTPSLISAAAALSSSSTDSFTALADFESLVAENLGHFIDCNIHMPDSCVSIASCLNQYADTALVAYASNPEDASIMLLTIFDLWVALDKLAVAQCPLLKRYSPEVPKDFLMPLLLRKSDYFTRLAAIETYIRERHRIADSGSVFVKNMQADTFAVRYFDSSLTHQSLLSRIQAKAQSERDQKILELTKANATHANTLSRARSMDHKYWVNRRGRTVHDTYCTRCLLEKEASNMRIEIHEWPLPDDPLQAKVVVFEMELPKVVEAWRTTTYRVLRDICTPREFWQSSDDAKVTLRAYYSTYTTISSYPRITFASITKSFKVAHYRTTAVPSWEEEVCKNNGLTFRMFDAESPSSWIDDPFGNCSIAWLCTFKVDQGPYDYLQFAVSETSHRSNQIIANQSDCPTNLTLHEHIAFGSLRSGPRLQWLNIARELREQSLSFHEPAVGSLLLQAAWQIGHLDVDGNWEWHVELNNTEFGTVLLQELEDFLVTFEANWLMIVSLRTVIVLACRLLASTTVPSVVERAYDLLRRARAVSFDWMHQLATKLQTNEKDNEINRFQSRLCETALNCRATYDVDSNHAPFLLRDGDDIAVLVESAIVIYGNTPKTPSVPFKILLDRDRRLSHSLEVLLLRRIRESPDGLNRAIAAIWSMYRQETGCVWERLDSPNDRWLTTTALALADQDPLHVSLNILDGCLLVDGMPLDRLPRSYLHDKDGIYSRILSQKVLDVIPADMPGMTFATRGLVSGYQLFFGMRDGALVIRSRLDSEILELLPYRSLLEDLPTLLVENYTHWLNVVSGVVEFRPLESLWQSSDKNWKLHFSLLGESRMCQGPSRYLVDIRSATSAMISARLSPLESRGYLTMVYSSEDRALNIELPRFRLSFVLNEQQELESKNMPGMVIDSNQASGTMFGLTNQLVLRSTDEAQILRSRRVIVPFGKVVFHLSGNHAHVEVNTDSQKQVPYQEYIVDADLGRLVGNGSLLSKLYKIYLHALTSHCLPDPLMGRTGTEESLLELGSAGCLSFQNLGSKEAELLRLIHALTPRRVFYPAELKVMQTVKWSSLPPTAQHCNFHLHTQSILEYAQRLHSFLGQSKTDPVEFQAIASLHLYTRASSRCTFYSSIISPTQLFGAEDSVYASRDRQCYVDQSSPHLSEVASAIFNWSQSLPTTPRLLETLESWGTIVNDSSAKPSYSMDWHNPNLSSMWLPLYNACRQRSKQSLRFELVFSLSSMMYTSPTDIRSLAGTILSFATIPNFASLECPPWSSYDLTEGFEPRRETLSEFARSTAVPFESSSHVSLPAHFDEGEVALGRRRLASFQDDLASQIAEFVQLLVDQWPCDEPVFPRLSFDRQVWSSSLFKIDVALQRARSAFGHWYRNTRFRDHIKGVQEILHKACCQTRLHYVPYNFTPNIATSRPKSHAVVAFQDLFEREAPTMVGLPDMLDVSDIRTSHSRPTGTNHLKALFLEFQTGCSSMGPCRSHHHHHQDSPACAFYRLYGGELEKSRQRLEEDSASIPIRGASLYGLDVLTMYAEECQKHVNTVFISIQQSMSPSTEADKVMFSGGLWPRITIASLLSALASRSSVMNLTSSWREVLLSFARALLISQRARRLLRHASSQNHEDLYKELANKGHILDQIEYTDWLLIQIENDFLARPTQVEVAYEMITPSSNRNAALQLNMGEGKSSVIVPMVGAALADGQHFVRVVVLKSLSGQMFQLLVERLAGIVNRRIFYMPFSRTSKLGLQQVKLIQEFYEECKRTGGILVVQPEHILSFKLMGIDQRLCSSSFSDNDIADALLESQKWVEANSRDILDESDEILHVRYQLVYTVGQQCPLEDHPERWTTIQQLLFLVSKHARSIQEKFPRGIEYESNTEGTFGSLRVFEVDAGQDLVSVIAEHILNGALPNCVFGLFPPAVRKSALLFLTQKDKILPQDEAILVEHCQRTESVWKSLLLLRGLLAHGILLYVLKERRWRVDYGLDLSRSLLAVPFRAKDVPSLKAEFGHPDVAVTLTCLSYYYQGLTLDQLRLSFQLLFMLDNPAMEYENWTRGLEDVARMPLSLTGVNMSDPEQWEKYLFPYFHRHHAVVNFFLSSVVFPREAKEFPQKLATSGWDLAEEKAHVTTGFSGTNDNRYLLPTSMIQDDPVNQLSTNAKVLAYLLQPENDYYYKCTYSKDPATFLRLVVDQTPEIRVLLDVGAQMLELQNTALVALWLSMKPETPAGVFFDENDELAILTQDGMVEPFISSPFNKQLEKCLVYLDDAHTRGTDLKLPTHFRAAVTLGPKVTKDRLLQGCMRMRKLGYGQSVMFFAPPEVDRRIRDASPSGSATVRALDILRWAMLETCHDIMHHAPHWAQQGIDYRARRNAWDEYHSSLDIDVLRNSWLQPEARTLEDMYGIKSNEAINSTYHSAPSIPEIRERCIMLGASSFSHTRMEEEQEREVNHEVEREREVERPPKAEPAVHVVHDDVRYWVKTGVIRSPSNEFVPLFSPLRGSSTASNTALWSRRLLTTKDFARTIQDRMTGNSGYLRPVRWITSIEGQFVVISPFEANELLPDIRRYGKVHLHIYAPRVTLSMKPLDDLRFYSIPSLPPAWTPPSVDLRNQLNLWAGQLYLQDYATYVRLCNFLGLYTQAGDGIGIELDGFIKPQHRSIYLEPRSPFQESPVEFLKDLIGLRRKGMSFTGTDIGKILHARLLRREDFETRPTF